MDPFAIFLKVFDKDLSCVLVLREIDRKGPEFQFKIMVSRESKTR